MSCPDSFKQWVKTYVDLWVYFSMEDKAYMVQTGHAEDPSCASYYGRTPFSSIINGNQVNG